MADSVVSDVLTRLPGGSASAPASSDTRNVCVLVERV